VPIEAVGADGKDDKQPLPSAPKLNHWNVWTSGLGGYADIGTSANQPGYSFSDAGTMLGADYRATANFVFGVVGTYIHATSFTQDGGSTDLNGGKLGAYATWWQNGTYAQGYAGGGYDHYDTQRNITIPGFVQASHTSGADLGGANRNARGNANAGEANVSLATGHDWKIGRLLLGPTLEGRYNHIGINHFSESGAESLDLDVHHQSADSLQSLVGARASYVWQVTPTRSIVPFVSVQWLHEYMDGAREIDASLLGQDFGVQTTAIGADGLLLNAGLTINWTDRVLTNIGYQGDLGRSDYSDNSFFGGFRLSF